MRRPAYPRGITREPVQRVPRGMRLIERSTEVPPAARTAVASLISMWDFKRRVGFGAPEAAPAPGQVGTLSLRVFGRWFDEPVRVVWAGASGFGYEAMPGHPLYGEESFVLDESGRFTARSISCPATWRWRVVTPALRILQHRTMAAYVRVVNDAVRESASTRR
ncbi:DUF1990 family protein [Microbacterium resistens]